MFNSVDDLIEELDRMKKDKQQYTEKLELAVEEQNEDLIYSCNIEIEELDEKIQKLSHTIDLQVELDDMNKK